MKQLFVGSILWVCLTVIFAGVVIIAFHVPSDLFRVTYFLSLLLMTIPAFYLTRFYFSGNTTQTVYTRCGLEGKFSGPDFDLPENLTISYRHAAQSPIITHYYGPSGYRGFLIDFGNGVAGHLDGRQILRNTSGGLSLKLVMNGNQISIT